MNQNEKRAAMPVSMSLSMSRNGAEHGFTILNVVVWLAVALLLLVFVPQACSVMQANTEL
jgi:competence protein ComGC